MTENKETTFFTEPAKRLPLAGKAEVLVAGGGPSGVAAAVCAARCGCSVILLESSAMPGGIMTSGLMSNIIDGAGKGGFLRELLDYLEGAGACGNYNSCSPEVVKHFFDVALLEHKVRVRYNTLVTAVLKEGDGICGAITESPSGREVFVADVYIDCTGNGTLACCAGCDYECGDPETGRPQASSLCALCCGVSPEELGDFCRQEMDIGKLTLREKLESLGCPPSYGMPTLFSLPDMAYLLMSNHEHGVQCDDADGISAALTRARLEIYKQVQALRKHVSCFAAFNLAATASALGIREGRRIRAKYRLSVDDLREGRGHEDGICRVSVPVDIHRSVPGGQSGYDNGGVFSKPYDIPLRSLQPVQCSNLLLGGRCICGDFWAHSTYRVLGNAIPTGEAAGIAAAAAVRLGKNATGVTINDFSSFCH